MNWRCPDEAVNLLHESALAARVQYQTLRPAFSDWLMAQGRRLRGRAPGQRGANGSRAFV